MQDTRIEKRIAQIRLAVWTVSGLLTFGCFRSVSPFAWQIAAFGALFTLLWSLVGGRQGDKETRRQGEEETDALENSTQDAATLNLQPSTFLEIGVDLLVTTILIGVSGGFGSPFAPLAMVVVLETFALRGRRAAMRMAGVTVLINLVHFRGGITPASTVLYGLAIGTLGAAMLAAKWTHIQDAEDETQIRNASLMRPIDAAELQAQLEEVQHAYETIKDRYRAMTNLNRSQHTQMARTQAIEQLCEISGDSLVDDTGGRAALLRVLRLVMEVTGADGGVLWLRGRNENTLTVQAAEGKIAGQVRQSLIPNVNTLAPDAIRAHCEAALLTVAPETKPVRSRLDALFGVEGENDAEEGNDTLINYAFVAQSAENQSSVFNGMEETLREESDFDLLLAPPVVLHSAFARQNTVTPNTGLVGVTLLRTRPTSAEPMGKILGAIGVYDPRRRQRFLNSEVEKVSSLCRALTGAISSISERAEAQRQVREVLLVQELHRMAQAAIHDTNPASQGNMTVEQACTSVVELVMELARSENCTLFLLDERRQRLEAKVIRGQDINLLDHIRFERGYGVAGWVASCGRPLNIPDLAQEQNLLSVEMVSPPVQSFLALPLQIRGTVIGVLNLSHAQAYAFTSHDVRLLTETAEQAALLLERAVSLQAA